MSTLLKISALLATSIVVAACATPGQTNSSSASQPWNLSIPGTTAPAAPPPDSAAAVPATSDKMESNQAPATGGPAK
jgi:hypothetical protein